MRVPGGHVAFFADEKGLRLLLKAMLSACQTLQNKDEVDEFLALIDAISKALEDLNFEKQAAEKQTTYSTLTIQ